MAQGSFAAAVSKWVAETKERQIAVRREAAQRTVEIMQTPRSEGGNMRVDTGFLRASLMAAIGDANFTIRENPGGAFAYEPGQVTLVIAQAQLSDPIEVVYTANYARAREYGARGQPGDRFVGLAAQRWPQTVNAVATEAKARAKP